MSEPTRTESDEIGPGTVLGQRYQVQRLLGEGGMGRVYLAFDSRAQVEVAVKVLTDDRPIPKAAERFQREAGAIARIEHENVVRISDVGESNRGGLYYVMEYLDGEELADTLDREGPMLWPRARDIALQVCDALHAAHEKGVVHRDLKLENCFRVRRGEDHDFIKILDFGVAKLLGPDQDDGGRLTGTGATVGTPAYMAPELCRGKKVDHRVDVYALGVMLFELVTGSLPFTGTGFLDVAMQHMQEPPPPLTTHLEPEEIPAGLQDVISRALAKRREDRFPTMAAFARALLVVGTEQAHTLATPLSASVSMPTWTRGGTEPALEATSESITGRTQVVDSAVGAVTAQDHTPPPVSRWGTVLAVAVLVAMVGGGAWWAWAGGRLPGVLAPDESVADVTTIRIEDDETVEKVPLEPPAEPAGTSAAQAEPIAPSPTEAAEIEPEVAGSTGAVDETDGTDTGAEPMPEETPSRPTAARKGYSRAQIAAAMRGVRPRLTACVGDVTGGKKGDRVRLVMDVHRVSGEVLSVRTQSHGTTAAAEECVRQAARKARFARGGRGIERITRAVTL
ncbi:MAG: protein kinase [Myxococcota bacterium]